MLHPSASFQSLLDFFGLLSFSHPDKFLDADLQFIQASHARACLSPRLHIARHTVIPEVQDSALGRILPPLNRCGHPHFGASYNALGTRVFVISDRLAELPSNGLPWRLAMEREL